MKRFENMRVISIYVMFIVLMIGVFLCKKNFHVDELLSYGLANDSYGLVMSVEDGVKYEPAERPFVNYLSVNAGEGFNYRYVWENQAIDVHPPLFYAVLHTICSFFPGQFSVWYAGVINIAFGLLTLMALRKLMDELFDDAFVKDAISVVFVLTAEVLVMVSFLRMYIMAMFWVTLSTWFFVKQVGKKWELKDYLLIFVISVLSALTHYYCVVYLIFICVVYGVWLLLEKKWKEVVAFAGTMVAAAGTAIVIFPAMLEHVFSGYRGTQSIKNFANASVTDYVNRLKGFYEFFDVQLFGGLLSVGLVLLIIGGLAFNAEKKDLKTNVVGIKWLLLLIPSVLYFAVIAKMAVYIEERYISPIFAVVIVLFLGALYGGLSQVCYDKAKKFVLVVISAIMVVNGWKSVEWRYLYKGSEAYIEKTESYSDVECIMIYDMLYKTHMSYLEAANYKSITFLHADSSGWLADMDIANNEELIVVLISQEEEKLSEVIEMCPNLDGYEKIGAFGYGTTYYLYGLDLEN